MNLKKYLEEQLPKQIEVLVSANRLPLMIITDQITEFMEPLPNGDLRFKTNGEINILTNSALSSQERLRIFETLVQLEKENLRHLN